MFKRYKKLKEQYNKDLKILQNLLEDKRTECKLINEENISLIGKMTCFEDQKCLYDDRIESLEKSNNNYRKQNDILIEWINKMINDLKIYETKDVSPITIPVYKQKTIAAIGKKYNDTTATDELFKLEHSDFGYETIVIPEIIIKRYR